MITDHLSHTPPTVASERPACLPRLTADDFCKAKYSHNDSRCYTARLLDVFLNDEIGHYVRAYREFRLATMDYLYAHHRDDHAATGESRSAVWNGVATKLGYKLVSMEEYRLSLTHSPTREQNNMATKPAKKTATKASPKKPAVKSTKPAASKKACAVKGGCCAE